MMLDSLAGAAFAMNHVVHGAVHLFLLDSMTHRDPTGKPHWVTLSVIALPPLDSTEQVAMLDCFLDGQANASIVAIGRWITHGTHMDDLVGLRFAVRPDVPSRRFQALPPDHVTCWVDEDRE